LYLKSSPSRFSQPFKTPVGAAGRLLAFPSAGQWTFFAHRAANLLVANPPQAAALEIGYTSAQFRVAGPAIQ